MKIKISDKTHLKIIYSLWLRLQKFYGHNPSAKQKEQWLQESIWLINHPKEGGILIAVESNEIIGYLSYAIINKRWGLNNCVFLDSLFVVPSFRKKGVATKLIKKLFEIRLPSFAQKIIVTAHPQAKLAISLYENLGFTNIGKTLAGNIKLEKSI